jgi:DNA-directed RNA polymerase subunit H
VAIEIENHELVPEHRKMEEDEINELLEEFNIDKSDLPELTTDDAMTKRIDVEPGDVIEINRESPTAGETTYYRRVTEE